MTDQKYVLCMWKKRLWPAEVLCKTGIAEGASVSDDKEAFLKVEILGVKEQVCVSCADAVPLEEESIDNIASNLDQNSSSEAVEELKYRCSLKIALDILSQNAPSTQVPPLAEEPRTQLPQDDTGSLSSAPLRGCQVPFHSKEKLELEASKRKREPESNRRLKVETRKQTQKGSLEESAKACGSGTDLSERGTGDLCDTSKSQNCKTPVSKSLPRQKKIKPELLTESETGNEVSLKPGEGAPLSVPCKPNTAVPGRRVNSRAQSRRMLDSSCESASDDLERSTGGVSGSLAKQVDGRRKPGSLKQVNGEQEGTATACSCRKKRCKNCSGSSSGPSKKLMLPDSSPSQVKKEEEEETSCVAVSKAEHCQLPDFEEGEGLESPDLSSKRGSLESPSCLSDLINEEEDDDDEELPSILSYREPQSIKEGILVWCKLRHYPYWPAVVKYVKQKTRKACVLLIDGNIDDKKRGFSVSLRNLKHFDCEERQDLIERAKEDYRQEIEWCIRLICDYRVRLGCHSFTGSFLEYFAADISYPVRKRYPGLDQMTIPDTVEEKDVQESASETSPQKPTKKLLPDRMRAARDNANKKIVDFIVKTKGAEEHLMAILKSRKQSQWLKRFLNSSQYMTCIETYLEDEEQLDLVVNYLKEVYHKKGTKILHHRDEIEFISDVLLPEAIIYAISAVDNIDYKKAEEKYIKGPSVSKREREIFDERIRERKRFKTKAAPADST